MKINRFAFLGISLILALISCATFSVGFSEVLTDEGYMEFLEENTGYDYGENGSSTFGLMAVGTFFLGFIMAIGHVIAHSVFLILSFTRLKDSKINFKDIIVHKNEVFPNIIRIIGYIIVIRFVTKYITNFYRFYLFNSIYHIVTIGVILCYVIWIISIYKGKRYA